MKYLLIVTSLLALWGMFEFKKVIPYHQIHNQSCPVANESDILRIHSFLTLSELEFKRKEANIEEFKFNIDDLESQHTNAFVNYWNERDVTIINTPGICMRISKSLMSDTEYLTLDEFSPIYYKVKSSYVVLFRKKRGHIKQGTNPVYVLDENYNIISKYKI